MSNEETNMPDDENIPLLLDVVEPNEIEPSVVNQSATNHHPPDTQPNLAVIREDLANRLNEEVGPIITAAITSAVDSATDEIRRVMLDELRGLLENRIHDIIEETLRLEFEK
jgi:hypothetical protein